MEWRGEERKDSRPLSQHQKITLHSEAGGSIDSILPPPPFCCDPETALWLHPDSWRENDGGNIKHKRVGCNNRHSLLSFSFVFSRFCRLFPEALRLAACVTSLLTPH